MLADGSIDFLAVILCGTISGADGAVDAALCCGFSSPVRGFQHFRHGRKFNKQYGRIVWAME